MRALVNYKSFDPLGERFQEIVLMQINRPSGSTSGLVNPDKCIPITNIDQITVDTKETTITNGKTDCYTINSQNTQTTYVNIFANLKYLERIN